MPETLPTPSQWVKVTARLLSAAGGDQTSPLDGSTQRPLRLGDKHAVDIELPAMEACAARQWLSPWKISQTEGATLVMPWPQPVPTEPFGLPKVNGGSQAGSTLICDGFTPNLFIPADSYFSFAAGGRTYLHVTTRDATVNASGQATLSIAPMLRAVPADNADLDFVTPKIEGFMAGNVSWSLDQRRFYGASFTLTENR